MWICVVCLCAYILYWHDMMHGRDIRTNHYTKSSVLLALNILIILSFLSVVAFLSVIFLILASCHLSVSI